MRSLRPWLRHAEKASTNRRSCRHPRPILDRTAAALLSLPRIGRPPDHQGCRCHRDRPRARRIPLGRDGPLTLFREPAPAGPRIGTATAHQHWARRSTAAAGPIPEISMPRPPAGATSQGPRPEHRRHAVPTREHQSGGTPIHAAPTRPVLTTGRGPPRPAPASISPGSSTSTSFVLAALRARHVDPSSPAEPKPGPGRAAGTTRSP
jgi:hypothetical protein